MGNGYVGPVIPGGDADLLGNLVNAVNGTPHVGTGDDNHVFSDGQDVGFILPVQGGRVDPSFGREPLDQRAVLRSGIDSPGALLRRLYPAYAGEILP